MKKSSWNLALVSLDFDIRSKKYSIMIPNLSIAPLKSPSKNPPKKFALLL